MDDTAAIRAHRSYQELRGLSGTTIRCHERELFMLAEFLRPTSLLNATSDDLRRWAESIKAMKAASRYVKISRIHSFYSWAVDASLRADIPSHKLPRPKVPQGVPHPIGEDALVRALDRADGEVRLWVVLAAFAGLRCCEIAPLARDQVRDTTEPYSLIVRGKGNKERVVPIGPLLLDELRLYGLPSRGALFCRRDGRAGVPTASRVSQLGNTFLHANGVVETMHSLRHRYGTRVHELTGDIYTVAELMGHANIQTSRGYARFSDRRAVAAALSIDEGLGRVSVRSADISA